MIPTLPALPPLPGENEDYEYRPAGRSIIALLAEEHEQLTELSSELAAAENPARELADVITAAITRHLSAEEQYLYPTIRAMLPDGQRIANREIERDTTLLKQLALLETMRPETQAFRDLARSIDDDLHRHRQACTKQIFPQLRDTATEADLIRLGNRVEVAKESAPTRPHPDSPATPPLNKVTDPALGVVDKVRDVVARRKTYPEDL
ncbi:MAG TPA: hemerythrin domain-containing protein [Micromonosporaceae bacterium]|nr:hemerythrin domain-containing protein [Micromonosporaceae bacterium]HCU50537.1 hemerythrin domain-containing protein [Micromonosporaceae bacterium]